MAAGWLLIVKDSSNSSSSSGIYVRMIFGLRIETRTKRTLMYILASFGKYFILPRFFAQFFCPDVSIWNFYLHGRSVGEPQMFLAADQT